MKTRAEVPCESGRDRRGFTLVEIVVVLGLIVVLAGVAWTAWRRPVEPARDAALATLNSLVMSARSRAALLGADAAVLVKTDPASPEDFLRRVVVCVADQADWAPVDRGVLLPAGIYLLPESALGPIPPGAIRAATETWTDLDGGDLRSTALRVLPGGIAPVLGTGAWRYLRISAQGTTTGGVLLFASGRPVPSTAGATVLFENPESVAGLSISRYGAVTFIGGRFER